MFTQWPECPRRTQLSVTQQTAGSRGAASWALRTGSSSDMSASPRKMLPSTPNTPPGGGVCSLRSWDLTGGFFQTLVQREHPPRRTQSFLSPGARRIGFRLDHPRQQTAAVFPVRRHFLAGKPDRQGRRRRRAVPAAREATASVRPRGAVQRPPAHPGPQPPLGARASDPPSSPRPPPDSTPRAPGHRAPQPPFPALGAGRGRRSRPRAPGPARSTRAPGQNRVHL